MQNLLVLTRLKRYRNSDIVLSFSFAGRGLGNTVFSISGLDNDRDFLSDSDFVCIQRRPEKVSVGLLLIPAIAKICPSTVRLLQKAVIQLFNCFGNSRNIDRIWTSGVKLKVLFAFHAAVFPKLCTI